MPILNVPSTMPYPPGYGGNEYSPDDISKFFDLNWPDHAGMLAQGYSAPGIGGLRGLGCDNVDPDTGLCLDSSNLPTLTPVSCPAGQIDNGGGICIPNPSATGTNYTCSSVALSSMSAQDMLNCGYPTTLGGALSNPPLNTPVTPTQAGLTAAQIAQLITATGNSAVSLIRTAAGGPYQVSGTNLIYNPANGLLTTAAGANQVAAATVNPLGSLGTTLGQYAPWIIAAIAAVMILPSLMGGKR